MTKALEHTHPAPNTGHHDHPSFLQHHFYTPAQQASAAKLGMWLFLGQELLFFSGLFMAYIAMRILYPETFLAAHYHLDQKLGAINTIVLITSSLTMALAVRSAQTSNVKMFRLNLILTIALAFAFLVVKYFEYSHKIHVGTLPGAYYNAALAAKEGIVIPGKPELFFSIYFVMTGMHGLHVLIGIGVLLWILLRGWNGHYHSRYYSPVENVGLYWHLVDLIWIFLFPLLYLVK